MPKYLNADETLTKAGQDLAAELYDPGVGSIISWLAEGVADAYARYGGLPAEVLITAQVDIYLRQDIALETFVAALVPFLRNLDAGHYDESHGASITTYFIGACRNRLGDVIRKYGDRLDELQEGNEERLALLQTADPGYDEVDGFDLARWTVIKAPHDLRKVLLLHVYEDMSLTEAAKRLGCNPATIRSQLLRQKQILARRHFAGTVELPKDSRLGAWAETAAKRSKRSEHW